METYTYRQGATPLPLILSDRGHLAAEVNRPHV